MKESEEPINQLVRKVLSHYDLTDQYDLVALRKNWGSIVGEMVAKNTTKLKMQNKTLVIQVNSAALKAELQFHKTLIVQKVNVLFNTEKINEVKIYN
jgi:predicted nucleic acid-binding Zn ribbon protein